MLLITAASWGTWSQWSPCSASCGSGRRTRLRECVNGNTCLGQRQQFENCLVRACPERKTHYIVPCMEVY